MKPLPRITDESKEYWNATKNEKLMLQKCTTCNNIQFYPRFFCIECHSQDLDWIESEGRGKVYTYTVIRRAPSKAFVEDVPYTLALIELKEGVRMMSTIVDDKIKIGDQVEVVFEEVDESLKLPKFKKHGDGSRASLTNRASGV
ncbi:Zn-ribbon domain-containing OB-fold protein [Alkalihalobacillus sp. BA299]|uniref:Zn-ribbon domain-containing OB-fold protein n=1 Tax=Alkalihalobacillus sp. BA299 TaxID=2815938 RepID=UPI001ADB4D61|nr:Zn-ribbon domain-containing OB-fold protein [Alkalihalobacillus sp. BA299]